MNERDLDTHPEERVGALLTELAPDIGWGNDPIGFLIASYRLLAAERAAQRLEAREISEAMVGRAWQAYDAKAGYSKPERFRAALEAALNKEPS